MESNFAIFQSESHKYVHNLIYVLQILQSFYPVTISFNIYVFLFLINLIDHTLIYRIY